MEKVKFGIIGTGAIAVHHAAALKAAANAELAAVYDTVPERAEAFAAKQGCRAFRDRDAFLASEIQAVTIGTPSGVHAAAAIPAANAGKHILCEKPIEVTVAKADELLRACEAHGVLLSSVFQSRFSESAQIIRRAIAQGRFGVPVLASASVRWYRNPEYYATAQWRGTWALDGGGALMNQGIHTIDLLLYFNGDVAEVNGRFTRRLHHGIEVEDTVAALITFTNGSLGTFEASTACAPGFPRRVELSGTRGSAVIEADRIVRWQFDEEHPDDATIRDAGGDCGHPHGGAGDPNAISIEGHRLQIEELAAAILEQRPLSTPGSEGRRTVELVCAVYASARSGQPVRIQHA